MADEVIFRIRVQDDGSSVLRGFRNNLKSLEKDVNSWGKQAQSIWHDFSQSVDRYGIKTVKSFVTTSIKKFAEFEQAMIGAKRTTGLIGEDFDALSDKIRELSTTELKGMLKAEDLAKIAETAGMLGVEGVENITKFTTGIAKISTALELSSEKTATDLAQIMNIFGEEVENVTKIGSSVNEISQNTVATARDILKMTQRMGGATKAIGMNVQQTIALSGYIRNLGIHVERGSTSMSALLSKMLTKTDDFVEAFKLNGEAFKKAIEENPVKALDLLADGMKKTYSAEGKQAFAALTEELLGSGQHINDLAKKMATTQDKLKEEQKDILSLVETSTEAYDKNKSIIDEFNTATETQIAKTKEIGENLSEVARMFGEQFKPTTDFILKATTDLVINVRQNLKDMFDPGFWDEIVQYPIPVIEEFNSVLRENILDVILDIGDKAQKTFNALKKELGSLATFISENFKSINTEVEERMIRDSQEGSEVMNEFFPGEAFGSMGNAAQKANDEIKELAVNIFNLKAESKDLEYVLEGGSLTPALKRFGEMVNSASTTTQQLSSDLKKQEQTVLSAEQSYEQIRNTLDTIRQQYKDVGYQIIDQKNLLEQLNPQQVEERAAIEATITSLQQKQFELKRSGDSLQAQAKIQAKAIQEEKDLYKSLQEQYRSASDTFAEKTAIFESIFGRVSETTKQWMYTQQSAYSVLQKLGMEINQTTLALFEKEKAEWQDKKAIDEKIQSLEKLSGATRSYTQELKAQGEAFSYIKSLNESLDSYSRSVSGGGSGSLEDYENRKKYRAILENYQSGRMDMSQSVDDYYKEYGGLAGYIAKKAPELFDLYRRFGTSMPALHSGGPVVKKYHSGGLARDEVPAILQTGEYVLSRKQVEQARQGAKVENHYHITGNVIDRQAFDNFVHQITQKQRQQAKLRI